MLGIDDGLFRFLVHGSRLAGRPSNIREPASLMMPSWNQVLGFLTDWEGLRRLAA